MTKYRFEVLVAVFVAMTLFYFFDHGIALVAEGTGITSEGLIKKINEERVNRSIPALITSPKLTLAAEGKTKDMFARGYFDHVDPDGNYVWPRVEAAGYRPYRTLGENLAIDFSSEDGVVKAWISSPTHRENLLRAQFVDQGLDAEYGNFQSRYTSMVTSLFGALVVLETQQQTTPPPPVKIEPAPQPPPTEKPSTDGQSKPEIVAQESPKAESFSPTEKGNEPAILLTPGLPISPAETTTTHTETSAFSALTSDEQNLFQTTRIVFIALAALSLITVFGDAILHKVKKTVWLGEPKF